EEARLQHGEADHRRHHDRARAPARAERRRVDAVVEGFQPEEAPGADQRQPRADEQEGRDEDRRPERKIGGVAHSITSPRIRNLASAAVATKPRTAMMSAASK